MATSGFANIPRSLSTKSYTFTNRGLIAGTYYLAGFYESPLNAANLTQAAPTVNYGTINVTYAAHAFAVFGGAGSASGGAGPVELVVTGTSITDEGVLTPADSEVIAADITLLVLDQYLETSKKWLGEITYTLQNALGSTQTDFSLDFNYGFSRYDDIGNRDFTITKVEAVGLAGANDSNSNFILYKHDFNNWTYHATNFDPGGTVLVDLANSLGAYSDLASDQYFSFKNTDISEFINGSGSEGFVFKIISSSPNSFQYMDIHVGIEL